MLAGNVLLGGLLLSGFDKKLERWAVGAPLNDTTFVPFKIVSKEQVSPTSFIITVEPRYKRRVEDRSDENNTGNDARLKSLLKSIRPSRWQQPFHASISVLEEAWEHGLWSVEIKQPQLQVARNYTPLPSSPSEEERADIDHGYLRFLIRKMDGGEVSTYLSKLQVGELVELRGPHLGFDVRTRLGNADRVVFLAGGTGIAPALQTARALLDHETPESAPKPSINIVWANRHRTDCSGCETLSLPSQTLPTDPPLANPITSLLAEMKHRHGNNLNISCTVDDEDTFINPAAITNATHSPSTTTAPSSKWPSWLWSQPKKPITTTPTTPFVDTAACPSHSQPLLASKDAHDSAGIECKCQDIDGHPVPGGKNLLMVSGPDGFISTFAGAKTWGDGIEMQGALGGVVGALEKRDPGFWGRWLALKL
ncbi:hypothetical protein B0T25DRAFT_564747 [Lasiosphaeria hispida]|uniref:FAD-binding FR-type domain-containing protein n=1 Tax=Lasiosphaeria hispida TaxID=260671 RepID=A0AAJ0MHY5_9PEZI|nr:hypothetical protein B0T25DRAFT_564747 [Lasiosphaeria hispida]